MRNKNPYLNSPKNINKDNVWYLIDKFLLQVWENEELFLESQNTNIIMMFEKSEKGENICCIARDDWQWIIEIADFHQRWLFVEEEDLKHLLSTKLISFYGDMDQFDNDLILFKLSSI